MSRALELAENGRGKVSPNPLVGCVIVHNDTIIGEGWHGQFGGPHAEVNAIQAVKDKELLAESAAYVTLEPCSHFGKTPPCADLLVQHRLKKVFICNIDPNPLVAGRGIERLKENNIEVELGLLKNQGEEVNKRFFSFQHLRRPYIILKWAQTADGFIARENYDSKWISNAYSRQLVHRMRGTEDAVLIGKTTALHDNPRLNVRDSVGKDPVRLVLDPRLELPKTLFLFDETQLTVCYNFLKNESLPNLEFVKVKEDDLVEGILADLYQRNIQSVIVEGGTRLISSFVKSRLWDEAWVFKSDTTFGRGIQAPSLKRSILDYRRNIVDDQLEIYKFNHG